VLTGFVNSRGEPLVRIILLSSQPPVSRKFGAVVDTGFNGSLSIPESVAEQCGWIWIGYESYEIASGDIVHEKVFWGRVRWLGNDQDVYAIASHAQDILIGTRLLIKNRISIDFPKREVRVR
jgi:clan AA aspartic protease